jgi:fatty acid desaturase
VTHAIAPTTATQTHLPTIEWPTLALIIGHWLAFVVCALAYDNHRVLSLLGLILILAFHSSLVHEIIHGHPFRVRLLNDCCGLIPMDLWLPYRLYKESHLKHHVNRYLTDPSIDPESNYLSPAQYAALSPVARWWGMAQRPLLGRLLFGSITRIIRLEWHGLCQLARFDARAWRIWSEHIVLAIPVVWFVVTIAHIPLLVYCLGAIVPSYALIMIRSFAEHKAIESVTERTAIVEHAHFLGPLYLYNNLHALHHDEPTLPWYQYQARFATRRAELLAANSGLWYASYWELFKRFSFKPQDVWIDPLHTQRTEPST